MWTTGVLVLCCAFSFMVGTWAGIFIIALLSANKEDDNANK